MFSHSSIHLSINSFKFQLCHIHKRLQRSVRPSLDTRKDITDQKKQKQNQPTKQANNPNLSKQLDVHGNML